MNLNVDLYTIDEKTDFEQIILKFKKIKGKKKKEHFSGNFFDDCFEMRLSDLFVA